jgi:hypothetical protein
MPLRQLGALTSFADPVLSIEPGFMASIRKPRSEDQGQFTGLNRTELRSAFNYFGCPDCQPGCQVGEFGQLPKIARPVGSEATIGKGERVLNP